MRMTFGIILIGISLFMLLGFSQTDYKHGLGAEIAAFVFMVAFPMVGGALLIRSHYRKKVTLARNKEALRKQAMESQILKLAAKKGGKLTVVEVVSETMLNLATAKEILDSLVHQSLASVEITDSGVIVYAFYDVAHLDEKARAKGILDA